MLFLVEYRSIKFDDRNKFLGNPLNKIASSRRCKWNQLAKNLVRTLEVLLDQTCGAATSAPDSTNTDRIKWFFGRSEFVGRPPQFQKMKRTILIFLLFFVISLSPHVSSSLGGDKDGPLFAMQVGGGCPMPPPPRGLIMAMPQIQRIQGLENHWSCQPFVMLEEVLLNW
jgi:hypothetical protein